MRDHTSQESGSLFPFVRRARFEDSQRRLEAFRGALAHERSLSDQLATENRRLRLELRLPGPNPPEGYFDV